jgi:ribosomal protein S6-L-glutamate ligase RimK-like protein
MGAAPRPRTSGDQRGSRATGMAARPRSRRRRHRGARRRARRCTRDRAGRDRDVAGVPVRAVRVSPRGSRLRRRGDDGVPRRLARRAAVRRDQPAHPGVAVGPGPQPRGLAPARPRAPHPAIELRRSTAAPPPPRAARLHTAAVVGDRCTSLVCPTQFQERVAGRDLRVHVVGDRTFACAIDSPADDYRYAHRSGQPVALQPVAIAPALAARCVALASGLGLRLAGIDLRRTADGRDVCFEVNTAPAFGFFDRDAAIADAIAALLLDPPDHPCSTRRDRGPERVVVTP